MRQPIHPIMQNYSGESDLTRTRTLDLKTLLRFPSWNEKTLFLALRIWFRAGFQEPRYAKMRAVEVLENRSELGWAPSRICSIRPGVNFSCGASESCQGHAWLTCGDIIS